jgi:hypothetical protein
MGLCDDNYDWLKLDREQQSMSTSARNKGVQAEIVLHPFSTAFKELLIDATIV